MCIRDRLDFERGYLTNGPYGDIFDVVTDNAPLNVIEGYGVLWPLGGVSMDEAQCADLEAYVRHGGILVLDAGLAEGFSEGLLGAAFAHRYAFASRIRTGRGLLGGVRTPYRFRPMKPTRDAEVLAWTGAGEPLLTWHPYGDGLVLCAATEHWLDERDHLLPLASLILRHLADSFLPVHWSADIEVLINRIHDGWVIGLVNNHGIAKAPTRPPVADPEGARTCLLYFDDAIPLQFIPRLGAFQWSVRANGLHTYLKPGGLAVVEVRFSEEERK